MIEVIGYIILYVLIAIAMMYIYVRFELMDESFDDMFLPFMGGLFWPISFPLVVLYYLGLTVCKRARKKRDR